MNLSYRRTHTPYKGVFVLMEMCFLWHSTGDDIHVRCVAQGNGTRTVHCQLAQIRERSQSALLPCAKKACAIFAHFFLSRQICLRVIWAVCKSRDVMLSIFLTLLGDPL